MKGSSDFIETVWNYYHKHGRDLPWRSEPYSAYQILVSEVMLQQTQVARVIPKYQEFLKLFPTQQVLAKAPLADVLRAWSGLGYNRRAKYLHDASKRLATQKEPWTVDDLVACKGIGYNTAAAVLTYAYNQPVAFIETNIRTVYIHHFFQGRDQITDKELLPRIEQTLDYEHPREFMWALMDYGSYLKATTGNASRLSRHHVKQSPFIGSQRQIRGQVLKLLHAKPVTSDKLRRTITDPRLQTVLLQLESDGLIQKQANNYRLPR